MSDLLVRLYALPPLEPAVTALAQQGIEVRRALAHERPHVTKLAREHGSEGWVAECDAAFARMPLACFVAVERATSTLLGFACYEATCRDFFGPELVHPGARGRGYGACPGCAARDARPGLRLRDHRLGVVGRLLSQGRRRDRDRRVPAGHLPAGVESLTSGR